MGEELQSLIEKIQRDGVERAEREAAEILSQAKERAEGIIAEAQKRAEERAAAAERQAAHSALAGTRALEQAARDVILAAGRALGHAFQEIIGGSVTAGISDDVLRDAIRRMLRAYAERGMTESRIEILLSAKDQTSLREALMREFAAAAKGGLEISAQDGLAAGFKLKLEDGRVTHDFSSDAIAEAISAFLGPGLAEIVHRAARHVRAAKEG